MKLLLVEDDIEISQMLKDYLKAENYEVLRMEKKRARNLTVTLTALFC